MTTDVHAAFLAELPRELAAPPGWQWILLSSSVTLVPLGKSPDPQRAVIMVRASTNGPIIYRFGRPDALPHRLEWSHPYLLDQLITLLRQLMTQDWESVNDNVMMEGPWG